MSLFSDCPSELEQILETSDPASIECYYLLDSEEVRFCKTLSLYPGIALTIKMSDSAENNTGHIKGVDMWHIQNLLHQQPTDQMTSSHK